MRIINVVHVDSAGYPSVWSFESVVALRSFAEFEECGSSVWRALAELAESGATTGSAGELFKLHLRTSVVVVRGGDL